MTIAAKASATLMSQPKTIGGATVGATGLQSASAGRCRGVVLLIFPFTWRPRNVRRGSVPTPALCRMPVSATSACPPTALTCRGDNRHKPMSIPNLAFRKVTHRTRCVDCLRVRISVKQAYPRHLETAFEDADAVNARRVPRSSLIVERICCHPANVRQAPVRNIRSST